MQAITTRRVVQLPEIMVTRARVQSDKVPMEEDVLVQDPSISVEVAKESELELSTSKTPTPVKAYVPPIPFPRRLQKHKLDA